MKKYEIMYIVNATLDDEQFQAVTDRLNKTVTENGGTIDQFDDWGIKNFAYEINHMTKGHYAVVNVTANNEGIAEYQRLARISNNVIRIMVLKMEDEKRG